MVAKVGVSPGSTTGSLAKPVVLGGVVVVVVVGLDVVVVVVDFVVVEASAKVRRALVSCSALGEDGVGSALGQERPNTSMALVDVRYATVA